MAIKAFEKFGRKKQAETPKTDWDNLNAVEFAGDTERHETERLDPEQAKAERQQRKITAYFLYDKNPGYIFTPDVQLNDGDEDRLSERIANGEVTSKDERELLLSIKDPARKVGYEGIYSSMQSNKHELRILAHHSGVGFNNYQQANPNSVNLFLEHFPTPMDFEAQSEIFLNSIKNAPGNSPEKVQEYIADMDKFKHSMYGKRQEYWEQIKALEQKAEEWKQRQEVAEPEKTGEKGESLIKGFGWYEMSRDQVKAGAVAKNPGERLPEIYIEDSHLCMPEQGLFGVFDGAGGVRNFDGGARRASQTAMQKVEELANKFPLVSEGNLAWALNEASKAVEADPTAGITTGTIAKIIEQDGVKKLAYATVGDSRIYIVRHNSFVEQITKDEGIGSGISNALGTMASLKPGDRAKQLGVVNLRKGDRIVLCTDGVTGDTPAEQMSDSEIGAIVNLEWDVNIASARLVEQARKTDDRTAIVVEV